MLSKTFRDIRSLKIQGAESIAIAGLKALRNEVKTTRKTGNSLLSHMRKSSKLLESARDTEPMLRNVLKRTLFESKNQENSQIITNIDIILDEIKSDRESLIENASKIIRKYPVVFTHCHSSSVTSSIIGTSKRRVFCTETRPRYQGHKTARELSNAGFSVTMTVDSAAGLTMKQSGVVLLGADAITYRGDVINKIGSGMIATVASDLKKPLYCITSSLKFDPLTLKRKEPIEHRSPSEVISPQIKGVKVLNPAFEKIPSQKIRGIITEFGITKPKEISRKIRKKRPWMFK